MLKNVEFFFPFEENQFPLWNCQSESIKFMSKRKSMVRDEMVEEVQEMEAKEVQ